MKLLRRIAAIVAYLSAVAALWEAGVVAGRVPEYIVPRLSAVLESFADLPGYYLDNLLVTAAEATAGLCIGAAVGFGLGLITRYAKLVGRLISPLLVASQVFPKEALAPIFLILFGFGVESKIVISALICFFPVAVATHRGLSDTPDGFETYMRTLRANPREVFWFAQLPFAIPQIFSALRVCATLSVVGSVVGEFVGSSAGLGYIIRSASSELAMTRIYMALLLLGVLGAALYLTVAGLEHSIRWSRHTEST